MFTKAVRGDRGITITKVTTVIGKEEEEEKGEGDASKWKSVVLNATFSSDGFHSNYFQVLWRADDIVPSPVMSHSDHRTFPLLLIGPRAIEGRRARLAGRK